MLVHIGRAARREGVQSRLTAAQWTCLRFFARANGSSRTPSAFADFNATTRGTASQIVRSLEARALIARTRSETDRRSMRFDLTDAGRAMLAHDPLRDMTRAVAALGSQTRAQLLETLQTLGTDLARRRDAPCFGTCRDCSHFAPAGDTGYCACMAADLAADDIDKLCASYTALRGTHTEGDHHGAA